MKNKKEIALGATLSYVQIAVGAVITLLYTPFMIRIMGQSEYGLYNTVSSVVSSLSLLSLGFGSCYVRFYSKYKLEEDNKNLSRLNGMFMTIFLVIGVIAFICGMYLTTNLQMVFDNGLTIKEMEIAKKLMFLLTLNLAFSFPSSVFSSIITANEKFIFQKIILLIKQVVSPLICIPLLLSGYGSVGIVLSTVIIYFVLDIINATFCIVKLKVKFLFDKFDWEIFKEMLVYSIFIAINMIVDQINLNVDKFLLGRYKGTLSVAIYAAGYTIYSYYTSFSTSISNVFIPRIHAIYNDINLTLAERDVKLSYLFVFVGRIQLYILLLVASGIFIFGKQFISIWAGSGYENSYYVLLLLVVSSIVPLSQNIGIEIQRAKNKHQFRAIIYLFMAIINLIMSIYLCQLYGEIGSALGTALSFLIANVFCMNIFYHLVLKIDILKYWKTLLKMIISILPAIFLTSLYCTVVNTYLLKWLIIGILLYSVMYVIFTFIFGLNASERKKIISNVKKIIYRILGKKFFRIIYSMIRNIFKI